MIALSIRYLHEIPCVGSIPHRVGWKWKFSELVSFTSSTSSAEEEIQGGIQKAVALGCDPGKSISRSRFSANVREVLGQTLWLWVTPGAAGCHRSR